MLVVDVLLKYEAWTVGAVVVEVAIADESEHLLWDEDSSGEEGAAKLAIGVKEISEGRGEGGGDDIMD